MIDAIALQIASGFPLAAVAERFSLELRQLRRIMRRKGFPARVDYYRGRLEVQAAQNLTRMILEFDRTADAVLGRGPAPNEVFKKYTKEYWDRIMPRPPKAGTVSAGEGVGSQRKPDGFLFPEIGQERGGEVPSRRKLSREVLERCPTSLGLLEASVAGSAPDDGNG